MSRNRPGRRTPLRGGAQLIALADAIAEQEHLWLRGVLLFDTQMDEPLPGRASTDGRRQAETSSDSAHQLRLRRRRRHVIEQLRNHGHDVGLVQGSGGASIRVHAQDSCITEISVGSVLYGPAAVRTGPGQAEVPAAGYVAEVMRQPARQVHAILGGGYTAADTLDRNALPRPYLPAGAELDRLVGAGPAQIPIRYSGPLNVGDPIFLRHANAGELCERFGALVLVEDGAIADTLPTYRSLF